MGKVRLSLIGITGAILSCSFAVGSLAVTYPKVPNPPAKYPSGELGKMVKLVENIIMHTNTNPLTKNLVANKLTCTSCYINGGKTKALGTFNGTALSFPAYSKRGKTVQSLQDRINNCFMRSMNGKRPIIDTKASIAMAAYVTWLSEGLPIKMNPKKPVNPYYTNLWPNKKLNPIIKSATHRNYVLGKGIYESRCSSCHGADGQGIGNFPPLWGKNSYNTGAGMSKIGKMASWVLYNMPLGNPNLSEKDAVDVSIYVDAQPHSDFDLTKHLFPRSEMGYYNSKVLHEKHNVRSNFAKPWGLDIDAIRGDHKIKGASINP